MPPRQTVTNANEFYRLAQDAQTKQVVTTPYNGHTRTREMMSEFRGPFLTAENALRGILVSYPDYVSDNSLKAFSATEFEMLKSAVEQAARNQRFR